MPPNIQVLILSYNFVQKMDLSKKFRVGEHATVTSG